MKTYNLTSCEKHVVQLEATRPVSIVLTCFNPEGTAHNDWCDEKLRLRCD